jgi:L-lysine exporter family protein LysE/ArgO
MKYFVEGLLLGLAYVAPIGVQNLFVINTAATKSRLLSYQTALIVVFFDITLALACFWGIGTLLTNWRLLRLAVLLVGSIAVCWIGISLLKSKAKEISQSEAELKIPEVIATACLVTWFNPQALIDGSLMLGAFRVSLEPQFAASFILGVCLASLTWFLSVTTAVSLLKKRIGSSFLNLVNKACGLVILIYGLSLAFNFVSEVGKYF